MFGDYGDQDFQEIEYDQLEAETDKAVLVTHMGETAWLPKSQINIDEDNNIIYVPEWLYSEKF